MKNAFDPEKIIKDIAKRSIELSSLIENDESLTTVEKSFYKDLIKKNLNRLRDRLIAIKADQLKAIDQELKSRMN